MSRTSLTSLRGVYNVKQIKASPRQMQGSHIMAVDVAKAKNFSEIIGKFENDVVEDHLAIVEAEVNRYQKEDPLGDVDANLRRDRAVIEPVSYTHLTLPTTPYV